MQLVYQEEEHIQLANDAQPCRYLSKTAAELAGRFRLELQDRNELSHTAGRNAGLVQPSNFSAIETVKRSDKTGKPCPQESRDVWGHWLGHGVD